MAKHSPVLLLREIGTNVTKDLDLTKPDIFRSKRKKSKKYKHKFNGKLTVGMAAVIGKLEKGRWYRYDWSIYDLHLADNHEDVKDHVTEAKKPKAPVDKPPTRPKPPAAKAAAAQGATAAGAAKAPATKPPTELAHGH